MHLLRLLLILALAIACEAQPRHLYLTWDNEDTAHTQTVVFQTLDRADNPRVEVFLEGEATAVPVQSAMLSHTQRRIHWVTLKQLQPATKYRFRAGDQRYGMSPWRSFKTLPADESPLTIASGGDMYRHPETVQLLKAVAKHRPDIVLVGGDIAYADGNLDRVKFWDDWLDNWEQHLNPKDGPLVGMICAIGNHEVKGAFGKSKAEAPFYFGFFPQGGQPYFVRRLGQDTEVVVLDSGHVTSHPSQVPFLQKALESMQSRQIPLRLALYHVPCYPTHRPYNDKYSALGRKHWVPLFDQYQVTAGLENHDHTCKRTHPLKGGKVVDSQLKGTVYLGDGCWGRTPRHVAAKRWYHAQASPARHVWILNKKDATLECQAIGETGKVVDRTTLKARGESQ